MLRGAMRIGGGLWTQLRAGSVFVKIGEQIIEYAADVVAWTEDRFILTEPTGTNLVPWSKKFITAGYPIGANTTYTDSGGIKYAGGGSVLVSGLYNVITVASTASESFTVSALVESDTYPQTFRLKNTHGAVQDNFSPDITIAGPGRHSFTVTNSANPGSGSQIAGIIPGTTNGPFDIRASIQLEKTAYQSSIMPTDGAPATRAAVEEAGTLRELTASEVGLLRGVASGVTLESGSLTISDHYEITATTADYFGAGLVVGDRFTATSALALSTVNSVQIVAPIRTQVSTAKLSAAAWNTVLAANETTGVLSTIAGIDSVLRLKNDGGTGGKLESDDGTNVAEYDLDWAANTEYAIKIRYGDENDMIDAGVLPAGRYFQIGVDDGGGVVWGAAQDSTGHVIVDVDGEGKAYLYLSWNIPRYSIQIEPPTIKALP
jgi:hypothetical protein